MKNYSARKWIAVGFGLLIFGAALLTMGKLMGGQTEISIGQGHIGIGDHSSGVDSAAAINEVLSPFTAIQIEVDSESLIIQEGDQYHLSIGASDAQWDYGVEKDRFTLKQKNQNNFWHVSFDNEDYQVVPVILTVPKGATFEEVILRGGVSEMSVEGLTTQRMTVENGVASTQMNNITVKDLVVNNGVGDFYMQGLVEGSAHFKTGVGSLALTLVGGIDDYNVDVTGGMGSVTVDGEAEKGMGNYQKHTATAHKNIEITSGLGDVTVEFQQ